ncbi:hypothetical protein PanWU01x14_362050 [Parasponia andersonii]|uniref:5'-3' DNA helicase ZGRF1-like N-terminal domain-containing protein n=1 Tax=Parasponia andersonii TaxID=3476 RepID=A0A2P5A737_PARAD|nr:hypothetical protein PanWU01x14_362050 [Parasponia andersonii]
MSSITEWEVMYTTQITQKAKKYHDGFVQLTLRGSIGRQLVLLDEGRSNLDSRFLKMGEKIESGATISFDAHLVEIGEPRGDHKSSGENSSKVMRETGIVHGQQNCAHRNDTIKTVKQEFVKNGFLESGASHNSQHMTESSPTEWKVLYTAQLTQKSKKYHDGFLKLTICGSRVRQAMLYDETRKLMNSGFLKREEVIRTGVSFVFDAYLVEIGEPEGNNAPLADLTAEGNSCNVVKETGKMHEQQNSLTSNKYVLKEKPLSNACLRKAVESDFNISSNIGRKESSRTAPLRDAHQILSFLQKPRTQKGMPADSANNNMTTKKGPLVSNAADLDFPEDDKVPKLSVAHEKSRESIDVDVERPVDIMPSEARSTGNGSQLVKGNNGNSHQQLNSNKMEVESRWCDGENAADMPSSSCGPVVDEKNHPEDHLTCAWEMDDCPSFDLGI